MKQIDYGKIIKITLSASLLLALIYFIVVGGLKMEELTEECRNSCELNGYFYSDYTDHGRTCICYNTDGEQKFIRNLYYKGGIGE